MARMMEGVRSLLTENIEMAHKFDSVWTMSEKQLARSTPSGAKADRLSTMEAGFTAQVNTATKEVKPGTLRTVKCGSVRVCQKKSELISQVWQRSKHPRKNTLRQRLLKCRGQIRTQQPLPQWMQ